jgi:hypothetical protein
VGVFALFIARIVAVAAEDVARPVAATAEISLAFAAISGDARREDEQHDGDGDLHNGVAVI